jgi:hypothetical protein
MKLIMNFITRGVTVTKPSCTQWHSCLGHPSLQIVQRVLIRNNLPVSSESVNNEVCDACQQGKAHQLQYPLSSTVSTVSLELVFSDIWGHAPESIGRKKYYVSFIDDFSKFGWVYTLKHMSKVFEFFKIFQSLVERIFDCKILVMQTVWGWRISKTQHILPTCMDLTPCIMSSCPPKKWLS